jgi:predicted  nucleic acid-binding Zn-ribbon protein
MLLEYISGQLEKHQKLLDQNIHTGVMLEMFEKEIEKLKKDVEKLKDATRDIKFSNGNGAH